MGEHKYKLTFKQDKLYTYLRRCQQVFLVK